MLVLSRRTDESLVINVGGETVVIRVLKIGNDRVRLGIDAPRHVSVHREEVAKRIAQEEAEASPLALAPAVT
jgi:carbon storage regulator